jgi:hypothetical protein
MGASQRLVGIPSGALRRTRGLGLPSILVRGFLWGQLGLEGSGVPAGQISLLLALTCR